MGSNPTDPILLMDSYSNLGKYDGTMVSGYRNDQQMKASDSVPADEPDAVGHEELATAL
ncbi:MAG: hypothetical protein M3258_08345 [Thermoproteota archaeon]|nr:hypothetical protein [Thermoproteota archaeon]